MNLKSFYVIRVTVCGGLFGQSRRQPYLRVCCPFGLITYSRYVVIILVMFKVIKEKKKKNGRVVTDKSTFVSKTIRRIFLLNY